uniref:Transmembrane protein n=1 Tax=Rhabditophanes sp. KR3021 TaxID=114890 RepID=A0AC35U7N4_9BILA
MNISNGATSSKSKYVTQIIGSSLAEDFSFQESKSLKNVKYLKYVFRNEKDPMNNQQLPTEVTCHYKLDIVDGKYNLVNVFSPDPTAEKIKQQIENAIIFAELKAIKVQTVMNSAMSELLLKCIIEFKINSAYLYVLIGLVFLLIPAFISDTAAMKWRSKRRIQILAKLEFMDGGLEGGSRKSGTKTASKSASKSFSKSSSN